MSEETISGDIPSTAEGISGPSGSEDKGEMQNSNKGKEEMA